jgi:hypothetical protein
MSESFRGSSARRRGGERRQHQRQHQSGAKQQQGAGRIQTLRCGRYASRPEHQDRYVERQREQGDKNTGAAHADG